MTSIISSITSNTIDNEMPKNSDNAPPKAEIKAFEYHWKYMKIVKKIMNIEQRFM